MWTFRLFLLFSMFFHLKSENHSLSKRSLLFPRATVLQFTTGLSVPLILRSRSINFSLCYQVNYDLPYNLTQLQSRIIEAKSNNEFDLSREVFYKNIVDFLNNFGFNGEQCLLKAICEISEIPMNLGHRDNLLEEIVHFLFTPSLDWTKNATDFSGALLKAENNGKKIGKCGQIYADCYISIVDLFTAKYIF